MYLPLFRNINHCIYLSLEILIFVSACREKYQSLYLPVVRYLSLYLPVLKMSIIVSSCRKKYQSLHLPVFRNINHCVYLSLEISIFVKGICLPVVRNIYLCCIYLPVVRNIYLCCIYLPVVRNIYLCVYLPVVHIQLFVVDECNTREG